MWLRRVTDLYWRRASGSGAMVKAESEVGRMGTIDYHVDTSYIGVHGVGLEFYDRESIIPRSA